MDQLDFLPAIEKKAVRPFRTQLLKWIGNKQRFAHEIVSYFPKDYNCYYEPFLGSGAVLATLQPHRAVGSDAFKPLMDIWRTLHENPAELVQWYTERYAFFKSGGKVEQYEKIKASYNQKGNGADLLFLCRSCYGGVVRFRKNDGYMSTPCGIHDPISPESFSARVKIWQERTENAVFQCMPYMDALKTAGEGDLIYCDPPYVFSQAIIYGGQSFKLSELLQTLLRCKNRGAKVALSIDGTKKSGENLCNIHIPDGLFEREIFVNCGRSMLRRFQMEGQTLESEVVKDRLLLSY
jgi:DNA adenine methylase